MNVVLWILQVVLALHTAAGALFKFSHSPEQTMPSLKAIPNGAWLAMSVVELLCALFLVLPAINKKHLGFLAPAAAVFIAAEMLLFSGMHVAAGSPGGAGSIAYWLVVAAVCAFVAYGRFVLRPFTGPVQRPR